MTCRFEALAGAYRELASGLSGLVRAFREAWPETKRGEAARRMIAGALSQLERLGVRVVYVQDEDPRQPGTWLRDPPTARVSIEWHEESPGPCVRCTTEVGRGPVGILAGSGPVCDPCLYELNRDLGSLLQAVNVMRELGQVQGEVRSEAMMALLTYASLYEVAAAKTWPLRSVGYLAYLRELSVRFRQSPPDWDGIRRLFRRSAERVN